MVLEVEDLQGQTWEFQLATLKRGGPSWGTTRPGGTRGWGWCESLLVTHIVYFIFKKDFHETLANIVLNLVSLFNDDLSHLTPRMNSKEMNKDII